MTASDDCYGLISNHQTRLERTHIVLNCVREMKLYRGFLEEVVTARRRCPLLSSAIPDRAYAFERHTRILLKESLDTLNELRDSGQLQSIFSNSKDLLKGFDPAGVIEEGRVKLRRLDETLDLNFFDEAAELARKLKIKVKPREGGLIELRTTGPIGDIERRLLIDGSLRPGNIGRVSTREFFGSSGMGLIIDREPRFPPPDCHHRAQLFASTLDRVDVYGGVLAGMARLKELAYRHARKVEELGHGDLQGADFGVGVIVGLIVVGLVLIGVGVATQTPALVVLGGIFVLAGIAGAIWGINVIIQVFVHLVGST